LDRQPRPIAPRNPGGRSFVQRGMRSRSIAGALAVGILLIACGGTSRPGPPRSAPTASQNPGNLRAVKVYAAVIRRLVTRDHTFGAAASPFRHIYVVDGVDATAASPANGLGEPGARFDHDLKEALRRELRDLPPLDFVSDPDSVRVGKHGMDGVRNNGVIITLGPLPRGAKKVKVSNSLWCGGLCGQWLTYVVELREGAWRVTGTTGPAAIS
jgi:hypothetical protein